MILLIIVLLIVPLFRTNTYAYWHEEIYGSFFSMPSFSMSIGFYDYDENGNNEQVPIFDDIVAVIDSTDPDLDKTKTYDTGTKLVVDGNVVVITANNQSINNILNGTGWWGYRYIGWEYKSYALYQATDVILLDGELYLVKQGPISGTNNLPYPGMNHWAITHFPNAEYDETGKTTYTLNQPVFYKGNIYQVVNVTNANANPPNVVKNSWNRVDTYYYTSLNVYSLNDVVIYNSILYISLTQNNHETPDNTSNWSVYNG